MIKKILFSQPQPSTVHNPYSRLEEQYGVQCDFYQFIHIEGLTAKEFRHPSAGLFCGYPQFQVRNRALFPSL